MGSTRLTCIDIATSPLATLNNRSKASHQRDSPNPIRSHHNLEAKEHCQASREKNIKTKTERERRELPNLQTTDYSRTQNKNGLFFLGPLSQSDLRSISPSTFFDSD
ncbi:hypothetical protein Ancab_028916 [Ancistrocladus abbreviatus]